MKQIKAKTLERVYIYIYIDIFNELKNSKINIKKDSRIKPVIDTG